MSTNFPDTHQPEQLVEVDNLEAALDQQEVLLRAGERAAWEKVLRRATIENRKAHAAAKKELDEFIQARTEPTAERKFKNLPEVFAYLEGDGWKIGKTKLYEDAGAGRITEGPDGTFVLSTVTEYARIFLRKEGERGASALQSLEAEKKNEEMLRTRIDRQHRELKLREASGELIRKADVEAALASRTIYLRSDLKNIFRAGAVEIIQMVGGDPQKAPLLIAYGGALVDAALDRYGRPIKRDDE